MRLPSQIVSTADDSSFDFDLALAGLSANATDLRIMLKLLVNQLSEVLGSRIEVERAGTRFRKSEDIKRVAIQLGGDTLEATVDGPNVRCSIGHTSGGIRIRSEQVSMNDWLAKLLGTLKAEAASSEATRLALTNLMIGGST
jgi:hypothetical protein